MYEFVAAFYCLSRKNTINSWIVFDCCRMILKGRDLQQVDMLSNLLNLPHSSCWCWILNFQIAEHHIEQNYITIRHILFCSNVLPSNDRGLSFSDTYYTLLKSLECLLVFQLMASFPMSLKDWRLSFDVATSMLGAMNCSLWNNHCLESSFSNFSQWANVWIQIELWCWMENLVAKFQLKCFDAWLVLVHLRNLNWMVVNSPRVMKKRIILTYVEVLLLIKGVFGESLKVRLLDYKLESLIRTVCVRNQEALIKS